MIGIFSLKLGLLLALSLALGCSEPRDDRSNKEGPLVQRLDEAFLAAQCAGVATMEGRDIDAQVELARIESVRAKVDPEVAFRVARALHAASACRSDDEPLRGEARRAYGLFRGQVARAVLGSSRSRATGDRSAEREFLVDLSRLVHAILPEDAARADQRVRQIDLASKSR